MTEKYRTGNFPFKPRARMLLLLGDQLIRDPAIAVFELVKNAYDADSPNALVTMERIADPSAGKIIIEDSGTGMDYETITNTWLEPGTDYRALQRESKERSPKYKRMPLGEKGVGRFAAHKLGSEIRLITRKRSCPEIIVKINWDVFEKQKYLDEVPTRIQEREPEVFTGRRTGTRIEISQLKNIWNRGMVRDLARSVTSICSPFYEEGEFKAELRMIENEDWVKDLLTIDKVLEYALFKVKCDITGGQLIYDYEFTPLSAMDRVTKRKEKRRVINVANNIDIDILRRKVGPIHIDLNIFDREPKILALGVTDKKGLKEFLDQTGGIRVYRDNIRVYDYGEPGNDWLNLGARRVNIPARRISNNLVIGAVTISAENSLGLIEKTNREGFVNNESFQAFKNAVDYAIIQIEFERNKDKKRIRDAYGSKKLREPVVEDITELRKIVEEKKLTNELGSYLDRIEEDFTLIRDRFLTSASAGLSLTVVIHEVEKGVAELLKAVEKEKASPRVKRLAKHIADLIEGFASLIRKSGTSRERASSLISQALFNTELRLKIHEITTTVNIKTNDFEVSCSRRLIISTLMNLIDNSIWWLDNKWGQSKNKKRIYIGTTKDLSFGPAIVVADNGPGFIDSSEYLIEPFISRKPDGMGLGLHIADQVMKVQGGKLIFPEKGDLSLPDEFDGAIIALVFGGVKT